MTVHRGIKFRAWNKHSKKMTKTYGFTLSLNGQITVSPDYEVMQYTGLNDCNGTEVCEDDVFTINGQIYVVKYEDGAFWSVWVHNKSRCLLHGHIHAGEIVGNIYEHPHLLKGEEA